MSRPKTLREILLDTLTLKGVQSVGVKIAVNLREISSKGFQKIALDLLLGDAVICSESVSGNVARAENYGDRIFRIIVPPGTLRAESSLTRRQKCSNKIIVSGESLLERLPEKSRPLFVVDLSVGRGRQSLDLDSNIELEIARTLENVRGYLWDENLAVTSSPPTLAGSLYEIVGSHRVLVTPKTSAEFLWSLNIDKVAVISRIASKPLVSEEILEYEAFLVIPPVSDDDSRIRNIIESLVPWGRLRRIELKGSTIGVPSNPSRVVCAILKAIFETKGEIDRAVSYCMSARDRRRRLMMELEARARKSLTGSYVTLEDYIEIASWLPVTIEEFKKACEILGLKARGL